MKKLMLAAVAVMTVSAMQAQNDWANHGRYAAENAALTQAPEVVFMGNSLTDCWDDRHPEFFTDNNFACRGISGQVSGQMLCRFYADVIDLKPKAVVILAGTNDIAGNQGHMELPHIAQNIFSMVELAQKHGICPILGLSVPCDTIPWNANCVGTGAKVAALKDMLKDYAIANDIIYVDYYTPLTTETGGLDPKYSDDRVHPNRAGYDVMEPLVLEAIAKALACDNGAKCCKKGDAAKCDKKDKKCCKKGDAAKCDKKGKKCDKKKDKK